MMNVAVGIMYFDPSRMMNVAVGIMYFDPREIHSLRRIS